MDCESIVDRGSNSGIPGGIEITVTPEEASRANEKMVSMNTNTSSAATARLKAEKAQQYAGLYIFFASDVDGKLTQPTLTQL